jgi:hypothetical protein
MNEDFETNTGILLERYVAARMPYSWGLGFSVGVTKRLVVAFDYDRANWSTFSFSREGNQGFRDETTVALGMELNLSDKRRDSWLKKSSVRTGYRFRALPMMAGGVGVGERIFTAGWGFPIGKGIGRLDIGAEIGSRGDIDENGMRERLFRLGVSLSAFEKWLPLDRRRRR